MLKKQEAKDLLARIWKEVSAVIKNIHAVEHPQSLLECTPSSTVRWDDALSFRTYKIKVTEGHLIISLLYLQRKKKLKLPCVV